MNLRQLIGQNLIIGISGHTITEEEKKFIVENGIGGVILMGRNVSSPEQVHKLCSDIQSLGKQHPKQVPLFISIDMEGGRVARLKSPFTVWPPMKKIGDIDSANLAFQMAMAMGKELSAVGINLDFAPCVDVFSNPDNKVIGDRSFSSDPEVVAKMASAFVRGFLKTNVISCVKHFPGHGHTLIDSHEDLPVEQANLNRLEEVEFIPFKKVFKSKADLVMSAHIRFPQIDPDWPATLSEIFLKKILREEMRFRGLIITDDLDMKALTNNYSREEIPVRAFEAGADLLLYCNDPTSHKVAIEALVDAVGVGRLSKTFFEEKTKNVIEFKKRHLQKIEPLDYEKVKSIVGHPDHLKISQAVSSGVIPEGLTIKDSAE